jgi:enoyl-CoA hydratase
MADTVLLERHGRVAHLVLNRDEKLNALDLDGLKLLRRYIEEIDADNEIRAVIVRGEGRGFSAGVDLDLTGDAIDAADGIPRITEQVHATFNAIEASRVPTIAAIHGVAVAGGLELTMVCDLAIAAEDARLADYHARYGLFPGGGASQRLPRLIGERRAKWLLLSGEWITAATAAEWGLINEVVPPERLLERADEMAQLLAKRSPLLNEVVKRTVRLGARTDLATALAMERPLVLQHMASEDARIGLEAFANRTEPEFVGR